MPSRSHSAGWERHGIDQSESHQADAECHKDEAEVARQAECEHAACDRDRQAREVGEHRPAQATETLEREVQS
jgi:hypothetical protein